MIIDIDKEAIDHWNELDREENGDDHTDLSPAILKEMIEEYLQDYFS